jgi:hypothetical protein
LSSIPLNPAIIVFNNHGTRDPLALAMSACHGERGEARTLATLRLQRRFVPDKKADIVRPEKNRRIPGIFASVAQPTQSVGRRNEPRARTKRGSDWGLTWPATVPVIHLYLPGAAASIKAGFAVFDVKNES